MVPYRSSSVDHAVPLCCRYTWWIFMRIHRSDDLRERLSMHTVVTCNANGNTSLLWANADQQTCPSMLSIGEATSSSTRWFSSLRRRDLSQVYQLMCCCVDSMFVFGLSLRETSDMSREGIPHTKADTLLRVKSSVPGSESTSLPIRASHR